MRSLPVSVIIPCFGRPDQTQDLLQSLRASDAKCEIILVDDASPVPLEIVTEKFHDLAVRYIRLEENCGPALARNIGAAHSENLYLAFTDNDCMVAADWLDHIFTSIQKAPENIAGVGGRVIARGTDVFSKYYDYHKILDPWYFRGKHYYVTTANAIFRKRAFESVGGFDESVRDAGGEDPGLCFKMQNAGYGLGYNPDAVVNQQYTPSLRAFMRTFYRYGFGCAGQSKKHYRGNVFVQSTAFGAVDINDGS